MPRHWCFTGGLYGSGQSPRARAAAETDSSVRRPKRTTSQSDEPKTARRFHIPEDEIDQYVTLHAAGDSFPNSHRSGWYHFIVQGLKALGLDQRHEWPAFHAKVKQL